MRLIDLDARQWPELKPYVDTGLIPIYPLCKEEDLGLMLMQQKALADVGERLEKQLTGRLLLLPALFYLSDDRDLSVDPKKLADFLGLKHLIGLFYIEDRAVADSAFDKHLFVSDNALQEVCTEEGINTIINRLSASLTNYWLGM